MGRAAVETPTLPHEPQVEIERARRVRERDDDFAFDWDAMLVYLPEESIAQSDDVNVCRPAFPIPTLRATGENCQRQLIIPSLECPVDCKI